jgi:uroporphyrinogen-III decarboxylase
VTDATRDSVVSDDIFEGWDGLGWRQRRARRLGRWLDAADTEFAAQEVRTAYRDRVQLVIDALELRKPARVPVVPQMGLYSARYAGLSVHEAMYDFDKLALAWRRFHEDFVPDFQSDAILPGLPLEIIGGKYVIWPGQGVEKDSPWQYVEAEYMKAEEYDALIADPSGYFMRTLLPRIAAAFEPLAALDPFADIIEAAGLPYNLIPFADPAFLEAARRLSEAGRATLDYVEAMEAMNADIAARLGVPPFVGAMVKAPYDILADTMRGTRGIVKDRYRQPEKILAAAERFVSLQIDSAVRQTADADCPLIFMPLHKGADGFMPDADFREFYWPTLNAVIRGLVTEGLVPVLFAEGGYNERLEVIVDPDIPDGSVIWWFDATDMVAAKKAFGGHACICGNVPGTLLALGATAKIEAYVRQLLDDVAGDGGFILGSGTVIDDATPEARRAMIETGRAWRG